MTPDHSGRTLSRGVAGQEERIRNDVRESHDILDERQQKNRKLAVRMVQRGIVYQQMSMSEKAMIWAPHLYCKQTGQSPALRVDIQPTPLRQSSLDILYAAMRDEFEQLWFENAS